VESIFFGSSAEHLYGVLHEPEGTTIRDFAVLICYPFGQEYMITHRALRTLCVNLARAGVPSLRFDYTGTGDSAGEYFSIEHAVEDTVKAAHELAEFSGMDTIKVIGLRLGAAIAVQASRVSDYIQQATLWDPVVNGNAYLQEVSGNSNAQHSTDQTKWLSGYPLSANAAQAINALTITPDDCAQLDYVHLLLSQSNPPAEVLYSALTDQGKPAKLDQSDLDAADTWIRADYQGAFLLPHRILKRIQEELLQERG